MEEENEVEFFPIIKERGEEYYKKGNIISCIKAKDRYYAKVKGNYNNIYNVLIELNKDYTYMECSCPFEGNCKHEYAVLNAIKDKEYNEKVIKKIPKENTKSLKQLIEDIPPQELKNYLINENGLDHVYFDSEHFEQYFIKYTPNQNYKYYYNKLYNSYIIEGLDYKLLDSYLSKINGLVIAGKFYEAYKIIKAIIESSNDTRSLTKYNYLLEKLPIIGMNLKIINRKLTKKDKKEMKEWIEYIKNNKYYNNIFLEEIFIDL